MNKTTLIITALVLIAGGMFFFGGEDEQVQTEELVSTEQVLKSGILPENTVEISGHKIPALEIVIEEGGVVTWTNLDDLAGFPYDKHTIVSGVIDASGAEGIKGVVPNSGSGSSDGMYEAGLALNESFEYTFSKPGSYSYYIAEHPSVSGQGSIIVKEKAQQVAEGVTIDEVAGVIETAGEVTQTGVIKMESGGFFFAPNVIRAKVGQPVSIDITSYGLHTFTLDEFDVDVQTPNGQTTRVEFTPDKAGTFTFYCDIPGHTAAGQIGRIIVE